MKLLNCLDFPIDPRFLAEDLTQSLRACLPIALRLLILGNAECLGYQPLTLYPILPQLDGIPNSFLFLLTSSTAPDGSVTSG